MRSKIHAPLLVCVLLAAVPAFAQLDPATNPTYESVTINAPAFRVPAVTIAAPTETRMQFKVGTANVLFFNHDGTSGSFGTQSAGGVMNIQASSRILMSLNGANGTTGMVTVGSTTYPTDMHVFGKLTGTNIVAKYQDVAEWVPSRSDLAPGTVVVLDIDHDNQVTASDQPYDTLVAGVVSSQPGLVLGEEGEAKEQIATTGRVRVRVDATTAPIHRGDLLVTSSHRGMAMKSEPLEVNGRKLHQPGTIIGKALEPLEKGEGEILVLLSLQ